MLVVEIRSLIYFNNILKEVHSVIEFHETALGVFDGELVRDFRRLKYIPCSHPARILMI